MITIHKYPIKVNNYIRLALPVGAKILTVQVQNNIPFIWALVDTNQQIQLRTFRIYETGREISTVGIYISTFQLDNGRLVCHLFETTTLLEIIQ